MEKRHTGWLLGGGFIVGLIASVMWAVYIGQTLAASAYKFRADIERATQNSQPVLVFAVLFTAVALLTFIVALKHVGDTVDLHHASLLAAKEPVANREVPAAE